ncbi:MAG: arsenic metallochaperone ArsD family protein [Cyclonatronaceae bacterium]
MEHLTTAKSLIEVYDPAMCCSTGVCGPDMDDSLADFANDVKWLKSRGIEVIRYNLGQEPEKFKEQQAVLARLKTDGSGKRVLLICTDPASNLKEVLETNVSGKITPIEGVANLHAVNIDPELSPGHGWPIRVCRPPL